MRPWLLLLAACLAVKTANGQDVTEASSGRYLSGEVPFASAFPELWVLDDRTYDQAVALLRDYHDSARQNATCPDWTCAECGESAPGTFDSFWRCGHSRH